MAGFITLGLTACAESQLAIHTAKWWRQDGKPADAAVPPPSDDVRVKVGDPYQVNGIWYYPNAPSRYDETGIASWYGKPFHGRKTANGETYDMNQITAAHKTLPLPSLVQVTNLDNGRSLAIRVNDRGPFVNGRIIDVSRRSAQLLGFYRNGTAKVRVSLVDKNEPGTIAQSEITSAEREALPALPQAGVETQELSPPSGVKSAGAPTSLQSDAGNARIANAAPRATARSQRLTGKVNVVAIERTHIYVQAGAFIRYENAHRLRARLASLGPIRVTSAAINGQDFFRVRLGPIVRVEDADRMLDRVLATGITDARIIVD